MGFTRKKRLILSILRPPAGRPRPGPPLLFFLLSLAFSLHSYPFHSIAVDGNTGDFDPDEQVILDPPNDSYWPGNEIYALYLTWDQDRLYLGCDYLVQNNALLLVLDAGLGEGVTNLDRLDWYPRKFAFSGMRAEFLIALWNADLNTGGARRILTLERTAPLENVELVNSAFSGDSGSIEVAIPWRTLYGSSRVPPGATLKLVGLIAGGDHAPGGESAPDNANIGRGSTSRIRTFLQVSVDADSNGVPDDSVDLRTRSAVVTAPARILRFLSVQVSPRVLRPGQTAAIIFRVSEGSEVLLRVLDETGHRVLERGPIFVEADQEGRFTWDGRGWHGEELPMGIYYITLLADYEVREKVAVVLVR